MSKQSVSQIRRDFKSGILSANDALLAIEVALKLQVSCKLLIARGDFIQLSDADGYELDDAFGSYERAHELDPKNPEPLVSLGHYFYAVQGNDSIATDYFRQALELGGGGECERMLREIESGEITDV